MEQPIQRELRRRMLQIAEVLRDPNEPAERLSLATAELEELLCGIHGVQSAVRDESARYRLAGKHGQVISPGYAVSTMQDALRTAKYLRALLAAIEAQLAKGEGPVHVLYAGSGPNAPFMVLPALCFAPEQVQFTLLDILPGNCEAVQKVISALALHQHIQAVVLADAAEYQHAGAPFHIVVAEIMQSGLQGEAQVAVSLRLAPQLAPDGVLIPERITLRAALTDPSAELSHRRTPLAPAAARALRRDLGEVFTLTRDSWRDPSLCEPRLLRMPGQVGTANQLTLLTEITLFEGIRLEEGESGLSMPLYLFALGTAKPHQQLQTRYLLGEHPHLSCEWLREPPRVSTPA